MASKKASGENIPEGFRNTEAVKLRLKSEDMQLLYSLATEIGEGNPKKHLSKTVAAALRALSREMNEECVENEHA